MCSSDLLLRGSCSKDAKVLSQRRLWRFISHQLVACARQRSMRLVNRSPRLTPSKTSVPKSKNRLARCAGSALARSALGRAIPLPVPSLPAQSVSLNPTSVTQGPFLRRASTARFCINRGKFDTDQQHVRPWRACLPTQRAQYRLQARRGRLKKNPNSSEKPHRTMMQLSHTLITVQACEIGRAHV